MDEAVGLGGCAAFISRSGLIAGHRDPLFLIKE